MARALSAVRLLTAPFLIVLAMASCACGSSSASTTPGGTAQTVQVSGSVARICPGPIIVGRSPHCIDSAVFKRGGKRWSVHGHFSLRLARGTYTVEVDGCAAARSIQIKGPTSGLRLVSHCAIPL